MMPVAAPVRSTSTPVGSSAARAMKVLLLMVTALFLGMHFLHLQADFPNNAPWMDWSKYTDEGWYGDGAIRLYLLGHWNVPGDFNPAAALPVWPALEAVVFHFTGVSLSAARALTVAVFAGILLSSWFLLRGRRPSPRSELSASIGVLLVSVSPFCFAFTRLAILEPLLILLTLLALLAARGMSLSGQRPQEERAVELWRRNGLRILTLGLLLPAMVLTKTTAVFLIPCVLWMLFSAVHYRVRALLLLALPIAVLGGGLWLAYFLGVVRPHYLLDYQYLFSANGYTRISRSNFFSVLLWTARGTFWIGRLVCWLALTAFAIVLINLRRLRAAPLIVTLLLWAFGYAAFLAYHNNLQPRYYLVVAIPLTLLLPAVFEQLVLDRIASPSFRHPAILLFTFAITALALADARQTLLFVLHPEYTFVKAAHSIRDEIAAYQRRHPQHNDLVLSISGSDLALIAGLHSICDDYGTLQLEDRVRRYMPGWYVAWNEVDDDKMESLTPLLRVTRVASFPALDDANRNLLILYRLDPTAETPPHPRHPKPTPRSLQTRFGQQPSTSQLLH